MDRLLHCTINEVQPDIRLLVLSNPINSCNGLKLQSGVEKWLAKENMAGVDEI
jgi:hypothetical protein